MMPETKNLLEISEEIKQPWHPHVIGAFNQQEMKLAKLHGEFTWHHHDDTDEVFIVLRGSIRMLFRDGEKTVNEGEVICVPAGVEHKPVAEREALVMLLEKSETLNTGNVENEFTVHQPPRL